jgi:putative protease
VVFDDGHPEQDEQGGRVLTVRPRGPRAIELEFRRGDVNVSAIAPGAIVWKTDDPGLRKRLEHSFSRDLVVRRSPVDAFVSARVGHALKLMLTTDNHCAEAESDGALQPATKFPATEEMLRGQLDRFGDTPFALRSLEVDIAGEPMVPKSVLNELRRRAVEDLLKQRERSHPIARPNALEELREEAATRTLARYSGRGQGEGFAPAPSV